MSENENKVLRLVIPGTAQYLLGDILGLAKDLRKVNIAEDGVTITSIPEDVESAVRELSILCDNHQATLTFYDGLLEDMRSELETEKDKRLDCEEALGDLQVELIGEEDKRADWGYVIEELQGALCREVGTAEKEQDAKNLWAGLFCVSTFILVATWSAVLAGWLRL
jgi:hypothetical protein